MKISYSWLQNYLNPNLTPDEVADLLTDIGLEVEGIQQIESVKGSLKGVVVGKVLTKEKHPNADRLNVTTVDLGIGDPVQIVCGAPNVNVGQLVPVATVGTWLYDGDEKFKIKRGKIRGEESVGMICAEYELGLGDDNEGIMVLDSNAQVGMLASEYFKIDSDIIFDIGLTPNRSDAMSHIGVARDLMTVLNHKGANLQMCIPSVDKFSNQTNDKLVSVEVLDYKLCPRYSGVSLSGIRISESPKWLKEKLQVIGITPTNNVVDITNYVLHETGQPLHAFDLKHISGNKIIVKKVEEKTKFVTLDEKERVLSNEDLMICDANSPLCIAGVFGGLTSGVTYQTTDIFLESAYFDPVSIRKTAKRHTLSTDASFRYERGCDPNITIYALKRAALLITEICGGHISSEIIDVYPHKIEDFNVNLSYSNMDNLIGEEVPRDQVKSILENLQIKIKEETNNGLSLLIPPFKVDVTREVDVIEEILRIYGYNAVKIPNKLKSSIVASKDSNKVKIANQISSLLSNNGFNEIMNNSLTKAEYFKLIEDIDESKNVEILNPLSNDLNVLRQSLLFGGLESIAHNQNRQNADLKFYEFGNTYHRENDNYVQNTFLQLLVTGRVYNENWNTKSDKVDFFYIKEKVEHILKRIGIAHFKTEEISSYGYSQGLKYSFKKRRIVSFGKIENKLIKSFGIKSSVYAADFNWDTILDVINFNKIKCKEISRFPSVRRDLSLLLDENIQFSQLEKLAFQVNKDILKSVNLFDVYEGDKLPKGKKSYALSFIMMDVNKTLTDKEVDVVMNKLIETYQITFGAQIR